MQITGMKKTWLFQIAIVHDKWLHVCDRHNTSQAMTIKSKNDVMKADWTNQG